MIDAAFGDTFMFNGRMRPEAVLGLGVQRRIMRAGPLAIELEADLFSHMAKQQQGGEFNQSNPYADLPPQGFGEGVLGIGARVWVQPWLSLSFVEGISYNSDVSLYEKTFRENYTQLLNYLGFEVEAAVSSDLSLVGRIHHRSGAFGTYGGVSEGSNAYLLGLRYRWGRDTPQPESAMMPPLPECADPDRDHRVKPSSLSDRLDSIALGDVVVRAEEPWKHPQPRHSYVRPALLELSLCQGFGQQRARRVLVRRRVHRIGVTTVEPDDTTRRTSRKHGTACRRRTDKLVDAELSKAVHCEERVSARDDDDISLCEGIFELGAWW